MAGVQVYIYVIWKLKIEKIIDLILRKYKHDKV